MSPLAVDPGVPGLDPPPFEVTLISWTELITSELWLTEVKTYIVDRKLIKSYNLKIYNFIDGKIF